MRRLRQTSHWWILVGCGLTAVVLAATLVPVVRTVLMFVALYIIGTIGMEVSGRWRRGI